MDLPAWVHREAWDGFADMREVMWRSKKIPWTDRAQKLTLGELEKAHEAGYDVNFMLDQSVLNGWRGVWVNERTPKLERRVERSSEAMTYGRVWNRIVQQRNEALFRKDGLWAAGCTLAMRTLNERGKVA